MRLNSIRVRLFVGMVAVSGAFVMGSVAAMTWLTDRMAESEVTHSLLVGANSYQRFEALQADLSMSRVWSVAETPFLKAVLAIPDLDHRTARQAIQDLGSLLVEGRLVLFGPNGTLLADSGRPESFGLDLLGRPGVPAVLSGEDYIGTWLLEGMEHNVAVTPVIGGSVILGGLVLVDEVGTSDALRLRDFIGLDVVMSTDTGIIGQSLAPIDSVPGWNADQWDPLRAATANEAEPSILRLQFDGRPWLAVRSSTPDAAVRVHLLRPLDDFRTELATLKPWILRAGLGGALLAALIGLWIARLVTRPLTQLRSAARDLGRGRLDRRVEVSTGGELGELGQAFNQMAADLLRHTKQLTQAKEEAEALSRAKSEFLANMSHEIRTPLNGVLATASVLKESRLDERQGRQVERVLRSGDHLLAIVNDILDVAKIEANMLTLDDEPFSLVERIEEVVELQRPLASVKGITLVVDVDPACPDSLMGDPTRVYQVLSNLVGNAVKFTDEGDVKVCCRVGAAAEDLRTLCVAVEDSGIGIPPDRLGQIFDKFTQADSSTTRRFGGTGLGLTICAQLIDLMGGKFGVESEVGVGSKFWFELPLRIATVAGSDRAAETPRPRDDDWPPAGMRVLLVEDNAINQEIMREMLAALGYEVDVVENGIDAVRALDTHRHSIVLMDCEMPVMDGFAATAEIRRTQHYPVPIVALTAHASQASRKRCLEAGMDDHLSKPVRMDVLDEMLRRWAVAALGPDRVGVPG